jgi:hypothetical protein
LLLLVLLQRLVLPPRQDAPEPPPRLPHCQPTSDHQMAMRTEHGVPS